MAHACYRGLYGETRSCKADLQIQILECDGCGCKSADGKKKEYVRILTRHELKTDVEGCKPWFTLADSGVRACVSDLRKKVISKKLAACQIGRL